ncbi:hypothetical protein C8F01DRAFT_1093081 [Mycena amicta]|nr:hypothetical protein C8F01DRAFT_1093081 [Mycena amicta]
MDRMSLLPQTHPEGITMDEFFEFCKIDMLRSDRDYYSETKVSQLYWELSLWYFEARIDAANDSVDNSASESEALDDGRWVAGILFSVIPPIPLSSSPTLGTLHPRTCWYAITQGRQIGISIDTSAAQQAVLRVPNSMMCFSGVHGQTDALSHFNGRLALNLVEVVSEEASSEESLIGNNRISPNSGYQRVSWATICCLSTSGKTDATQHRSSGNAGSLDLGALIQNVGLPCINPTHGLLDFAELRLSTRVMGNDPLSVDVSKWYSTVSASISKTFTRQNRHNTTSLFRERALFGPWYTHPKRRTAMYQSNAWTACLHTELPALGTAPQASEFLWGWGRWDKLSTYISCQPTITGQTDLMNDPPRANPQDMQHELWHEFSPELLEEMPAPFIPYDPDPDNRQAMHDEYWADMLEELRDTPPLPPSATDTRPRRGRIISRQAWVVFCGLKPGVYTSRMELSYGFSEAARAQTLGIPAASASDAAGFIFATSNALDPGHTFDDNVWRLVFRGTKPGIYCSELEVALNIAGHELGLVEVVSGTIDVALRRFLEVLEQGKVVPVGRSYGEDADMQ